MNLPKPVVTTYTTTLPSDNRKVQYRAWVGSEEKALQVALMDDDKTTIENTMNSVIEACTFGKLKPSTMTDVDIDWMIAQLRAKSVGEIVELVTKCPSCNKDIDFGVNLFNATVEDNLKEKRNEPIKIADDIYFKLRLPSRVDYQAYINNPKAEPEELIASMIEVIYTSTETFSPEDYTKKELEEYILTFNKLSLKEVYDYVKNMPKVVVKTDVTCRHCKTENVVTMEGTEFFFV